MTVTLRSIIFIVAIGTAVWILFRVRKSKVRVEDAVFWFCLAVVLFIMGCYPPIVFWISYLLGIQSPANCVFLIIIALLLEKIFTSAIKISQLEDKMEILAAEVALRTVVLQKQIEDNLEQDITGIDEEI